MNTKFELIKRWDSKKYITAKSDPKGEFKLFKKKNTAPLEEEITLEDFRDYIASLEAADAVPRED